MRVVYYVVSVMKAYAWVHERTSPWQRRLAVGAAAWAGKKAARTLTGHPMTPAQRRAAEKLAAQTVRSELAAERALAKDAVKDARQAAKDADRHARRAGRGLPRAERRAAREHALEAKRAARDAHEAARSAVAATSRRSQKALEKAIKRQARAAR